MRNRLSPWFMTRVGALPIEAAHALRCAEASAWAERVLEEQQRLRVLGSALEEALTALVADTEPGPQRGTILALRRDVFNNRLPRDAGSALDRLAPETGESLTRWMNARRALADLVADGAQILHTDLCASRAELRRLANSPRLRAGLLLASPTLEGRLDAYIAAAQEVPDKRARRMERSLLGYLYRTACKTSPFSTFTTLAPGRMRFGGAGASAEVPEQLPEQRADGPWTSHPRINVVALARLAETVAGDPARRRDLPVMLASGLALGEDRIRYVQRSVLAGDDKRSVGFDAARDRVFFLRTSGILTRLLAWLQEADRPRCADLASWLCDTLGADPADAEQYLGALLHLGLLQLPHLATDVHQRDPLRSFQDALRLLERPWADELADRLDGPVAWIGAYAVAGVTERAAILRRLRRELLDVQHALGAEDPTLPQALIYEDVTAPAVQADGDLWARAAGEPLAELAAVLPAFDTTLPQKLTFKRFFTARYGVGGSCDDLLAMIQEFHEDLWDDYLETVARRGRPDPKAAPPAEDNWLGAPEIDAIDQARRTLVKLMTEHAPAEGVEEFELPHEVVDEVAAILTAVSRRFSPQCYFVQRAERPGEAPLTVLNDAYGALCFPFTRFSHFLDDAGLPVEELRRELRASTPSGAVFAEVTGGAATTNLNLHTPLTDYRIVCPGESDGSDEGAQTVAGGRLDLAELRLVHDERADRLLLYSPRLDREVIPLYFGYLIPDVLPEVPRTLLMLAPTFTASADLWRGVPTGPASDGVTHRPRLRYRDLVLARRSWRAISADLPLKGSELPEAEWFLAWRQWQRTHGIPTEVFVTVRPQDGAARIKPQYVDFDSPLSLLGLEGLISAPTDVVDIEEMLPASDGLTVRSAQGHHVSEAVLELCPITEGDDDE